MKKLVRVKERSEFEANVFGGDCFCRNFPEILTTGVEVELISTYGTKFWFVLQNGKPVNDTAFFSKKEMKYLEEIPNGNAA